MTSFVPLVEPILVGKAPQTSMRMRGHLANALEHAYQVSLRLSRVRKCSR